MLTHECAHVEVTERLNAAVPEMLLQTAIGAHERCRWDIIKACWTNKLKRGSISSRDRVLNQLIADRSRRRRWCRVGLSVIFMRPV